MTVGINELDGVDEAETVTVDFDSDGASTDEVLAASETAGISATPTTSV